MRQSFIAYCNQIILLGYIPRDIFMQANQVKYVQLILWDNRNEKSK